MLPPPVPLPYRPPVMPPPVMRPHMDETTAALQSAWYGQRRAQEALVQVEEARQRVNLAEEKVQKLAGELAEERQERRREQAEKQRLETRLREAEETIGRVRRWIADVPEMGADPPADDTTLVLHSVPAKEPEVDLQLGDLGKEEEEETESEKGFTESEKTCSLCFRRAHLPIREFSCKLHRLCSNQLCWARAWSADGLERLPSQDTEREFAFFTIVNCAFSCPGVGAFQSCNLCRLATISATTGIRLSRLTTSEKVQKHMNRIKKERKPAPPGWRNCKGEWLCCVPHTITKSPTVRKKSEKEAAEKAE